MEFPHPDEWIWALKSPIIILLRFCWSKSTKSWLLLLICVVPVFQYVTAIFRLSALSFNHSISVLWSKESSCISKASNSFFTHIDIPTPFFLLCNYFLIRFKPSKSKFFLAFTLVGFCGTYDIPTTFYYSLSISAAPRRVFPCKLQYATFKDVWSCIWLAFFLLFLRFL